MRRTLKLALAGTLVALVAGCGGGGSLFDDLLSTGEYGAIASSWYGASGPSCNVLYAGIAANLSSEAAAESAAISQCNSVGGVNCTIRQTFGSAYSGAVDCGALATGIDSSGECTAQGGDGNSVSAAEADALTICRNRGYGNCRLMTTPTGGRFGLCAR